MNDISTWIFTFGSGQQHAGKFVKIQGTWEEARQEMFSRFGRNWSFQYSEEEWEAYCKEAREFARKYLGGEENAFIETELL